MILWIIWHPPISARLPLPGTVRLLLCCSFLLNAATISRPLPAERLLATYVAGGIMQDRLAEK
ncbi:hypothetical protein [Leisingera daeponensis]|uniref:hypothetical protein n=1 Tax=Leisingera daeponensis TaxID=405746 RepID=UPI001C949464|nr:hypothetical protein [Leisingera daeponensis]MBY6057021.1 hypothetical protein [Leisingera daeponensis]